MVTSPFTDPLLRRLFDVSAPFDGCVDPGLLESAGISEDVADSLARRGALTRVLFGVSVVGARALSDRQFLRSALLAAGPGAVISHRSAAALHGLLEPDYGEVCVTVPGRRKSRRLITLVPLARTGAPGVVRIRGSRAARERVQRNGFPIEAVAGTMVRLAGELPARDVVRAWKEADYRNKLRAVDLERQIGKGIAGSLLIAALLRSHPIVSDDDTNCETPEEFALLAAVLRRKRSVSSRGMHSSPWPHDLQAVQLAPIFRQDQGGWVPERRRRGSKAAAARAGAAAAQRPPRPEPSRRLKGRRGPGRRAPPGPRGRPSAIRAGSSLACRWRHLRGGCRRRSSGGRGCRRSRRSWRC